VSHAGDGNFHLVFVVTPEDADEMAQAQTINARLVHRALAMGGTCGREHGVGLGKIGYLQEEHGETLEVMRTIKRALDPQNLMNPGKMIAL